MIRQRLKLIEEGAWVVAIREQEFRHQTAFWCPLITTAIGQHRVRKIDKCCQRGRAFVWHQQDFQCQGEELHAFNAPSDGLETPACVACHVLHAVAGQGNQRQQ